MKREQQLLAGIEHLRQAAKKVLDQGYYCHKCKGTKSDAEHSPYCQLDHAYSSTSGYQPVEKKEESVTV